MNQDEQGIADFWQFSCDIYKKPEVFERLHKLQDECKQNINKILFALWLSNRQILIETSSNQSDLEMLSYLERWIIKVRRLRNRMKHHPVDSFLLLRPNVLELELKLEKLHQKYLVSCLSSFATTQDTLNLESIFMQNLSQLGCLNSANYSEFSPLLEK